MTSFSGTGVAIAGGNDTIVALATPPGRSAIAMVRVSGTDAHAVAGRVITPWPVAERSSALCSVRDPMSGLLIDQAIVTVYANGRSFTGEPMVEIATHGGYLVPATAMAALIAAGAREALPGEFTRRAVLNGKLDLLRAEAIGDLIDARSRLMQRSALAQLDGGLSRRIQQLRQELIEVEALIAYDIDFPEEDDGPIARTRVLAACEALLARLDALLATAPAGAVVQEGAIVVLAGPTNAGKSSLYNALLGESRALVTEIPGTTRDALESVIDVEGWPLRLVDTAGLRESVDALERLGIEVSQRYLRSAHLVLACADSPGALESTEVGIRAATTAPIILVQTKVDLVAERSQLRRPDLSSASYELTVDSAPTAPTDLASAPTIMTDCSTTGREIVANRPQTAESHPHEMAQAIISQGDQYATAHALEIGATGDELCDGGRTMRPVGVSALTGEGLSELRAAIVKEIATTYGAANAELPILTRARHVRALASARAEVAAFRDAWVENGLPAPVAAVHLRDAVVSLESLIGAVDVEDVLDQLFGAFCIGK